jgi:predicted RNA-binding protein
MSIEEYKKYTAYNSFTNLDNWAVVSEKSVQGTIPRPQGSLPMFNWGLKKEEQIKQLNLQSNVLKANSQNEH